LNYEEALDYFRRYSEQVDEDEFGYLYQGTCLINLGRYKEAVQQLKKALGTAPPDSQYLPEIYQELAFGYSELGEPETALYYLEETRSLDCDHTSMEIIKGHILLANKRPEEAAMAFRGALKQSDDSPRTMLRIIVSLYDNQYIQTSYTFLKHLLKDMDDDWNEGYSYMVLCCRDLGKGKEFLHYLKLASEKNPKEARTVLSGLFPNGMDPKDYYQYILNQSNKA
jgi:tetratricopeptide (TPR) repeat protein